MNDALAMQQKAVFKETKMQYGTIYVTISWQHYLNYTLKEAMYY